MKKKYKSEYKRCEEIEQKEKRYRSVKKGSEGDIDSGTDEKGTVRRRWVDGMVWNGKRKKKSVKT